MNTQIHRSIRFTCRCGFEEHDEPVLAPLRVLCPGCGNVFALRRGRWSLVETVEERRHLFRVRQLDPRVAWQEHRVQWLSSTPPRDRPRA
jgi:hypothetical protein